MGHIYEGKQLKYFFWICVNSYEVDGKEIQHGAMKYHDSERPITSNNWRRATQQEVDGMKWWKGNYYNHDQYR